MHFGMISVSRFIANASGTQRMVDEDMRVDHIPIPAYSGPETEHFRGNQKLFRDRARPLLGSRGDFLGIPLSRDGPIVGAVSLSRKYLLPLVLTVWSRRYSQLHP